MQIGDANRIAERTGICTVGDLRRRDVAAGGHGAPLLPALHAAMLGDAGEARAVLNLGGIANLTLLPTGGGAVRGFDTGPANALLDAWCERHLGHGYDAGGAWAGAGALDEALLARLLDEPWFAQPPPKSSGREQFHLGWVESRLRGGESAVDVQRTLLELTAASVADALLAQQPGTRRLMACGGGVHNPLLADRLRKLAGRRGWSESETIRRAVEHGLLVLEAEVPASLEVEEDDALRAAIAALEQIPDATFAAVGKPPAGDQQP
jgi:anhydro-N-acetylmuramic acid kinase